MKKPEGIFIGFKKAGSTLIRDFFTFHPEIYWTRNGSYFLKPNFQPHLYLKSFENIETQKFLIDMYEQLSIATIRDNNFNTFDPNEDILHEYFECNIEKIAKRILNTLKRTKILIIIREQISWISSYYIHHILTLSPENRNFQSFLKTPEGKSVLFTGQYDRTIKIYYKLFGKENVMVYPLELLVKDFKNFNKISNFFGLKEVNFFPKKQVKNKGLGGINATLIELYSKLKISDKLVKRIYSIGKKVFELFRGAKNQIILKKSEIDMLKNFYSISNYNTSKLINIDLKNIGYPI